MAFFALLWKARTIEKYRLNYEREKINSIVLGNTQMEQTLSQRWSHYRRDTTKRISRTFKKWYPEGSSVANFFLYLRTDQTFPNFLLKSVMGFVGGIILTYLCFMFFVFQLSISLIHATIMSSIIGVLLTLGLAFSYRIRCLVFLLIPQFFSRVGRYTLTCYALVLILTGPATNTLKNSEVLSESMACSQEQIKTSVHQLNDLIKKPFNTMKDSLKVMVDRLEMITAKVKETVVELDRLVLSIVSTIQSSFSWLESVADICNAQLGTPYERCENAMNEGISDCKKHLGPDLSKLCDVALVAHAACYSVKPFKAFCYATDFMDEAILASVKKKLRNFGEHLRAMFHVEVHLHHSYSYSSNTSRSASQVAAGIVTEIRNRADPLLTWLSWSSCVTSLFLLLIIFRAKYYQHMYETRSRFDNRYVTKELQELDLKRQRQGRETVLPLNRRERAKYINTTSFRLVASEKVYLNRSAVFMAITTLKLLIHMVADYSLYWVLMTIRYHGRYQTELMPGIPHSGAHVSGSGYVARLFSSIIGILDIPLSFPAPSPITCLPDPYPPDLRRYTQIGVLIFLLWFFALFEPYGLRLRHLIMGHYRPERAKARATWLYNHILRTRASFMKFARRKLHRDYKYSSGASLTFRQWVIDHIPFQCLKSLLGLNDKEPHCLLCGITSSTDPESELTRCHTRGCPGIYCLSCFQDIGALCTICMSPADYGDLSDVSLEKGSSDDSDSDHSDPGGLTMNENVPLLSMKEVTRRNLRKSSHSYDQRWQFFKETCPGDLFDAVDLPINNNEHGSSAPNILRRFHSLTSNLRILYKEKQYTLDWVTKVSSENTYNVMPEENNDDFDSSSFEMEDIFNETRSVGVNTDRNRGMIINILMNNFSQRRIQFFRNKHRNLKSSHKEQQGRHIVSETNRKTIMFTKTLHSYNLTIPKINTRNIKNKKTDKDKYKMNLSKEFKGTTSVMKYFMKSSDVVEVSNQNSNLPANHDNADNSPIDNTEDTTDSIDNEDNADFSDKKNKKKLKNKKPKRQRKPKDVKKIKKKGSRQGINEIQTFFSTRWNNFKCSLMKPKRSDSPTAKEKKNHKRRKKRKGCIREVEETDTTECFGKKDIKQTRNLRISAFLAELEWSKKEYRKEKETGVNKDTFSFPDGSQRITTNKIIGMVHLKNLPFQWREAPKQDHHCDCQDKKCSCPEKSDKCMKIFGRLSKFSGRTNNKKNIEKFRNKISSMDAPSSLMAKMLSTINAKPEKSTAEIESSICIAKRESFYRQVTKEVLPNEKQLDTDMLFKNENFISDYNPEPSESLAQTSKFISSNTLLEKELIISHSKHAKCLDSSVVTSRCRCDFYDDLQRKWTHVKRSISDKFQTPISMLKNLRSSLFGPSCTKSTCPNKTENKVKPKIVREKKFFRIPGIRSMRKNKPVAIQTDKKSRSKIGQIAVQTNPKKDMQTQLTEDDEVEKCIKAEMKRRLQEISSSAQFDADACKKQMKMLLDCLNKETEKIAKSVESKSAKSGIVERPDSPPADKVKIAVEKRRSKSTPVKTDQSEVVEYPKSQPPSKDDVVIEKPTGRSAAVKPEHSGDVDSLEPQSPQSPQTPKKDDKVVEKKVVKAAPKSWPSENIECSEQHRKKDDIVVEKKMARPAPPKKSSHSGVVECQEEPCPTKDECMIGKTKSKTSARKIGAIERSGTPSPTKDEIDTTRNKQKYAARRPGVERPGTQSPYKDCIPFEDKITKTNAQKPGNLRSRPTSKPDVAIGKKVSRSASPANPRLRLDDECEKRTANRSINAKPDTASGICQVNGSCTLCNRSVSRVHKPPRCTNCVNAAVGSSLQNLCDEGIQGVPQDTCTCATQHELPYDTRNRKRKPTTIKPLLVSSFTLGDEYPITTKKNEHKHAVHKGTKFSKDRRSKDKGRIHDFQNKSYNDRPTNSNSFEDEKSGVYRRDQKLSLESSLCILNRSSHTARQSAEVFTDPETDTSISSISFRSDETRTDTTICSIATVDYENSPRRRKFRVKVFTKTNQATLTDKTKLCDTGTVTQDWWSPLVERKSEEIIQDKKKGLVEKQKNNKEPKQWKELKLKKKRRNCGVTTDGRIVTFRSRTQIIPAGFAPGANDIMSPSRYLLESQRYYNELFAYNFVPAQMDLNHVSQNQKEKEKLRSPLGTRRNHHRKTKRLEDCYSPRKQISPRKRYTDPESPRRRHTSKHTNYRHYSKYYSPRKVK